MKTTPRTAIFDIDGTLFRSSLLIELVEDLVREEVFPQEATDAYSKEKTAWLERSGPYEQYIQAVVNAFMRHIKGVRYTEFMDVAQATIAEHRHHTYRYTRDLITTLKQNGYYLLAISQSPKGVLDEFCRSFGFDKVYGRLYELGPEDRFTGNVTDLHLIANKANIVRRAAEKEKLNMHESVGVGDTEDDIPFLEQVQYPICFNPNSTLFRHAKLNNWHIVVERKDVVYHIHTPKHAPQYVTDLTE